MVIPTYAFPAAWLLAAVAMAVEVRTVTWLLRRTGRDVVNLTGPLWFVNLLTWFPFLVAVDHVPARSGIELTASITGLEILVFAFETILIRELCAGRLFFRDLRCGPVSWRMASGLSLAGNLASTVMSVAAAFFVTSITR